MNMEKNDWHAARARGMVRTSDRQNDKTIADANALGEMARRLDNVTVEITALTAGETNPTLAVLFLAGLSNAQRNAAMRAIISVPGVCIVETLELYNEIVSRPDPLKLENEGFDFGGHIGLPADPPEGEVK